MKREALAHLRAINGVSQRRASEALAVDRSSMCYRSVRPDDDEVRAAMKAVAVDRRRFGYSRIHGVLEWQGSVTNLKNLRDLSQEEAPDASQGRPEAGGRSWWSASTVQSCALWRPCHGACAPGSNGTTWHSARRCKTASSRA